VPQERRKHWHESESGERIYVSSAPMYESSKIIKITTSTYLFTGPIGLC